MTTEVRDVLDQSEGSDLEVLYLAGTARSGSTVLSILLNASADLFSPGELSFFFRDVVLGNEVCSCGVPSASCPLWSTVLASSAKDWTDDVGGLERLTRSMDSHGAVPLHLLGLTRSGSLDRYCTTQIRLFRALSHASGARVIVDSSKYAARALALKRCLGGRMRILCLTRSPGGIIHSFLKPNRIEQRQSSVLFAAAYYSTVLAELRAMAAATGDVLEITYEELSRAPVATVERIERWGGWDLARTRRSLVDGDSFEVGHMVTANRVRKEGKIRFRPVREPGSPTLGARATARILSVWRSVLRFRRL